MSGANELTKKKLGRILTILRADYVNHRRASRCFKLAQVVSLFFVSFVLLFGSRSFVENKHCCLRTKFSTIFCFPRLDLFFCSHIWIELKNNRLLELQTKTSQLFFFLLTRLFLETVKFKDPRLVFVYRCSLRKIARHEEPEFSNASILNSMEKFVKTVNEMEETILVPSRLLDLSVGDATDAICQKAEKHGCANSIKDSLSKTDLYRLYNIVNQMKVELLWSQENPAEALAYDNQVKFCFSYNVLVSFLIVLAGNYNYMR